MCLCWYVTVCCFGYGIIYSCYETKINKVIKKNYYLFLTIFSFALIALFIINIMYMNICDNLLFYTIKYIVFVTLIILITFKVEIGNTVIKFVYSISYELYLVHGLIILMLEKLEINTFILFSIIILVSILLSYLVKKISNKIIKIIL